MFSELRRCCQQNQASCFYAEVSQLSVPPSCSRVFIFVLSTCEIYFSFLSSGSLLPRCRVKQLSVTRAVITRLIPDKSESEQLVLESQRSERCLFFCLRARWKDAAMLLGADSRVCLAGGRAQSVLHFTQQQTGEKTGGEGLTVREKRSKRVSGNRGKQGETEAGTKSTERTVSHVELWFEIQIQLWRGHFVSFSPELAKRQVKHRHWQQDCRNHNHEYKLHYLTWALTS